VNEIKIVILTGSNRIHASSTRLCRYIEKEIITQGHEVLFFDLYQKPIPFYSPDSSIDTDANLLEMKASMLEAQAVILGTPDYHGSISGVLKNALDHLDFDHFDSKVVLAISSAGGAVGTSSLLQLQAMIRNVHGINCPEWISIGSDQRSFNGSGEPDSPKVRQRVAKVLTYFLGLAEKLSI
jgi:NAD(P)H-dependent FMN reductase